MTAIKLCMSLIMLVYIYNVALPVCSKIINSAEMLPTDKYSCFGTPDVIPEKAIKLLTA